jgi:hypothetical protein
MALPSELKDAETAVGSLYVRKTKLGKHAPPSLTITIEG